MSRGSWAFKKSDVTRALEATIAAGIEVQRVEIDKEGKIVVVTGKSQERANDSTEGNEWDNI